MCVLYSNKNSLLTLYVTHKIMAEYITKYSSVVVKMRAELENLKNRIEGSLVLIRRSL